MKGAAQSRARKEFDGPEDDRLGSDHYRRQLEAVANNATLALFIMDEHQHCTYMNPAAEQLTGYTLSELLGKPLHDSIHHTRPDGTPYSVSECPIDRAFPQNLREQGEEVFVHKDGHFYPVAFTASPVRENGRTVGTIVEVRDITAEKAAEEQRKRLLRELEVERARLATVFQQAPAMIAVVRGPEHVFEMANAPYYRLIGHRDVLGKPAREGVPELVGMGFIELLDQVYRTGEPFVGTEVPVLLQPDPGAEAVERFVDFVYQPLREADGSVSGILGHAVDVTDRVRARTEVEEANRAKTQFLANMSHELRTPLNAIAGYVDLLQLGIHGPLTDAQKNALERVNRSQRHLLTLIQDILSFARLEAGRVEFDPKPLRVCDLFDSLEPLVAPQAEARGITLTAEACDADVYLLADEERVRQILLNLVGNAIKFTPEGGWVKLECAVDGDGIAIRVRDNGPGIPPEKQEAIFEPFAQIERRLDRPQEGLGLGLAISRELARAMGGELTVESAPGAGSTFRLSLHAAQPGEGLLTANKLRTERE